MATNPNEVSHGEQSSLGEVEETTSENVTRTDTVPHEDNEALEQLSDNSDTGWDTDLEVEEPMDEYDSTGCKNYLKACSALGIIPASSFMKALREGQPEVVLKHRGLGPKGAKAIAVALMTNTTVSFLDLSDNGLEVTGGLSITTMLKDNNYITHLDLSGNLLGSPGAFAVASMAKVNNTITHCYLSGNHFDDKAAEPIGEMIKGSYRITVLDLSHNDFGEEGGIILGASLAESEVLHTVNLSWNHIRGKGGIAIADSLKSSQSLKVLNISDNGLGNEGAIALANALKVNSTLEELNVSNNRIYIDGAVTLSKLFATNDTLKVLMIGRNPLEEKGVLMLLNAIKMSSNSALQLLNIEQSVQTPGIEKLIGQVKEARPHVEVVCGHTGCMRLKSQLHILEKLKTHAADKDVVLSLLFLSFDKRKCGMLTEADFRDALKHMSAPLTEDEIQQLIQKFSVKGESVFVNYKAMIA